MTSTAAAQPKRAVLWVQDADAASCKDCKAEFSLFTRRHHCRGCGQIFCGNCSAQTITLNVVTGDGADKVRVCSTCYQREIRRKEFVATHLPLLIQGELFKKHASGIGLPKSRTITLSNDLTSIVWINEKGEERGRFLYADVLEIKTGQTTSAFKRTGTAGNDAVCFSLVCRDRTLDLESANKQMRDKWVAACREASAFLGEHRTFILPRAVGAGGAATRPASGTKSAGAGAAASSPPVRGSVSQQQQQSQSREESKQPLARQSSAQQQQKQGQQQQMEADRERERQRALESMQRSQQAEKRKETLQQRKAEAQRKYHS